VYLLDTNVISELRKVRGNKAHPNVASWAASTKLNTLFISVMTLQELEIGILLVERKDRDQGAVLRKWFDDYVHPVFGLRTLEVTTAIALASAKFYIPNPSPTRDALIAATALVHGMTVVTRNVTDFEHTGVKFLNPWL
jgi:toxin FitB